MLFWVGVMYNINIGLPVASVTVVFLYRYIVLYEYYLGIQVE